MGIPGVATFLQIPTKEEQEFLNGEGMCLAQGLESEFWRLIRQRLIKKLDDAQESIDLCLSGDPKVTHGLHLRRYAIKSVITDLTDYIDEGARRYRALLADLSKPADEEQYEHYPNDPAID